MTEFTGAGDPDKTLTLLWRSRLGEPRGGRGPKQRVTVDQIVDTAVSLADAEGIDAVSMRNVAERLGIAPMSLYTYVDTKAALIDLMVDRITAEVPREPFGDTAWRSRLERLATDMLAHYAQHPWVLQIAMSRPPLGPGISDLYEHQLSAVDGIGLTDLQMDAVVTLVGGFVAGVARAAYDATRTRDLSGQSDTEWWEANAPVLESVIDGSRYPISGRVGMAAGEEYQSTASPDHGFAFGLATILDGVEQLLSRRPAPRPAGD
jgi:AcrR family transcriptional regulator